MATTKGARIAPAPVVCINAGAHRGRVHARRDALVEAHLSLVEGIARAIARSLPPCFDIEDLIGVGNLALLHAATRYRPGAHGGAPFSAFARPGVRGAIMDSVRRKEWTAATMAGLEDATPGAIAPTFDRDIDFARMARGLAEALSWLPPAQVAVLERYYGAESPTPAQAAARLAFGGAELRRVHADAIAGLRARFRLKAA